MIKAFYNEKNSYRKIYIFSAVSQRTLADSGTRVQRACNEHIYRHMRMENNVCIERYRAFRGKDKRWRHRGSSGRIGKKKKKIRDATKERPRRWCSDFVVAKGGRDRFGGEGRLNGTRGQCLENRRGAGHQLVQMHRIEVWNTPPRTRLPSPPRLTSPHLSRHFVSRSDKRSFHIWQRDGSFHVKIVGVRNRFLC